MLLVASSVGCDGTEPPPPPPTRDAGPRMDAGPRIIPDAGPPLAVDGVLDDPQWARAVEVSADVATDRPGSTLRRLLAYISRGRLYVGVEGTIAAGDALVVYVDGERGGPDGVADPTALIDAEGGLDVALSQELDLPADLALDVAVGTRAMPRSVTGLDPDAGWRDLADQPDDFRSFTGEEAPLVCGANACEAAIDLSSVAGDRPRELALFARIVAADGSLTNQTLPEDDAGAPGVVRAVLRIEDGDLFDAGVPLADAGVDAGPPGSAPVIDGVVGATEWAGAAVETNALSAAGTPFAGNALTTVRLLRDADRLYMAVEGSLVAGNAILAYVDANVGGVGGVPTSTASFGDLSGALDTAISTKTLILPSEHLLDFVWGTLEMPASGASDRVGWRDVATDQAAFAPPTSASTACSASACETSIALADLGATPSTTIGVFVRLGSAAGSVLSNQTLPQDVDPEFAVRFIELRP